MSEAVGSNCLQKYLYLGLTALVSLGDALDPVIHHLRRSLGSGGSVLRQPGSAKQDFRREAIVGILVQTLLHEISEMIGESCW